MSFTTSFKRAALSTVVPVLAMRVHERAPCLHAQAGADNQTGCAMWNEGLWHRCLCVQLGRHGDCHCQHLWCTLQLRFRSSRRTSFYFTMLRILEQAAGHLRWKVYYPPSQPVGSGFEPHWRPQPAKLPSFGGYSLETLPYLTFQAHLRASTS